MQFTLQVTAYRSIAYITREIVTHTVRCNTRYSNRTYSDCQSNQIICQKLIKYTVRGHLQTDYGTLNIMTLIMTLREEVQPMILLQQLAIIQCRNGYMNTE